MKKKFLKKLLKSGTFTKGTKVPIMQAGIQDGQERLLLPGDMAMPSGMAGPPRPITSAGTGSVKSRDYLYRLMISQLFYDGYQQMAIQLAGLLQPDPPCPPADRLFNVVMLGLERESEMSLAEAADRKRSNVAAATTVGNQQKLMDALDADLLDPGAALQPEGSSASAAAAFGCNPGDLGPGLDFELDTDVEVVAPEPALYETAYVTSHKGSCRAGAISADGTLCATGSADASIKVLDVERMLAKSSRDHLAAIQSQHGAGGGQSFESVHPVIRTLYDHYEEVTCLQFHPRHSLLASGSRDCTVKLFDYSKVSAKKASRTIQDASHIEAIAFHPAGEYLAVGVNQPVLRLYNVNTSQCFVASNPSHQHTDAVTSLSWSADGKLYASASLDGSVKIWDGVSSNCICTFSRAHDGFEVTSVQFARNGKYLLSSGIDSLVKLWELSTTRCLIAYTGAGATGKQEFRAQAVFNHTEDYVMFPDEATTSLCCWDARSASRKQLLSLGHNSCVRHIVHSPVSSAFLSCSDDFRARFWVKRPK